VYYIYIDGADVLYNKFNVVGSSLPINPPRNTNSDYKCVVDNGGDYWRLSRCTEQHHVVCQSGWQLVDKYYNPTRTDMKSGAIMIYFHQYHRSQQTASKIMEGQRLLNGQQQQQQQRRRQQQQQQQQHLIDLNADTLLLYNIMEVYGQDIFLSKMHKMLSFAVTIIENIPLFSIENFIPAST